MADPLEYRQPAERGEMRQLAGVLSESFPIAFRDPDSIERWPQADDPEHVRVGLVRGVVVAGLVALPAAQWFGGRRVGTAGLRIVGVAPEHRGRGVATDLLRAALHEAYEAGQALSTLYPATQPLYRRVGYEQAGVSTRFRIDLKRIGVRDRERVLRRVDITEPSERGLLQSLYNTRAARSAGNMDRSNVRLFWDRVFQPRQASEARVFCAEGEAGAEGYVAYGFKALDSVAHFDLLVSDFVALTARAARRLVAHLALHRSLGRNAFLRLEPAAAAFFCVDEQELCVQDHYAWMIRVVDVKRALEERGYPGELETELHLEVQDDLLPWNHGRFVLRVASGRGEVRQGGSGTLRVQARGLAPLFSGYLSAHELRLTGLADGDETEKAAQVFAGPRPWMPDWF